MKRLILLISILLISLTSFSQRYTIEASSNVGFYQMNGVDYPQGHYAIKYDGNVSTPSERVFTIYNIYSGVDLISSRYFTDVLNVDSWDELSRLFTQLGILDSKRVTIENQTTPVIILPMAKEVTRTTLAANSVVGLYDLSVVSSTGFVIGHHLRLVDPDSDRFYYATILDIQANVITLDTQLDFVYLAGSQVVDAVINMAVNGALIPVIFKHRLGSPSTPSDTDITRIILTCTTSTSIDLSKFGDLAPLGRGLTFRKVGGRSNNLFNIKTNADLSNIAYDFVVYDSTNPAQGLDGFSSRLTFAGTNKIGVALRVGKDDNLEVIIQDDLTGLTSLVMIVEGHATEN